MSAADVVNEDSEVFNQSSGGACYSKSPQMSPNSANSPNDEMSLPSSKKVRRSGGTDQRLSLDYMRVRNATESLIRSGGDLKMNDIELREAIKRAMFFESSSRKLIGMRRKQINIMKECLELDNDACKQMLNVCKTVLNEKFGINTAEIEHSLNMSMIHMRMNRPMDMTRPPPDFRRPPPHIPPFLTPPFALPTTTSFTSAGGHLAPRSSSSHNLLDVILKVPPNVDFSSTNSKISAQPFLYTPRRTGNFSHFGKFRDRDSWKSNNLPAPGLVNFNVKGSSKLRYAPYTRSPKKEEDHYRPNA